MMTSYKKEKKLNLKRMLHVCLHMYTCAHVLTVVHDKIIFFKYDEMRLSALKYSYTIFTIITTAF